ARGHALRLTAVPRADRRRAPHDLRRRPVDLGVRGRLGPGGPPRDRRAGRAMSAFAVGSARAVLSATHVRAGQDLVVAACVEGTMRTDFPFFPSFDELGKDLADDVRLLHTVANADLAVAAKDISMAGLVGSLAMLLEWGGFGASVDL